MSHVTSELTVEAALAVVDSIQHDLDRLRGLLRPAAMGTDDPKDPRNKLPDGKLTERGVEVCFRLFDAGMTRYGVKEAMGISYGAATNRFEGWKKAGGHKRQKMPVLG